MRKTKKVFRLYIKEAYGYTELGLFCTYSEMYNEMKSECGYSKNQVVRMLKSGKMEIRTLDGSVI